MFSCRWWTSCMTSVIFPIIRVIPRCSRGRPGTSWTTVPRVSWVPNSGTKVSFSIFSWRRPSWRAMLPWPVPPWATVSWRRPTIILMLALNTTGPRRITVYRWRKSPRPWSWSWSRSRPWPPPPSRKWTFALSFRMMMLRLREWTSSSCGLRRWLKWSRTRTVIIHSWIIRKMTTTMMWMTMMSRQFIHDVFLENGLAASVKKSQSYFYDTQEQLYRHWNLQYIY